jgi:DNA polymerase-3 subunit gamma/tau
MRDEAKNSLLKLLEEPPSAVNIILTSQRREAIMPTILSRLRPYRFLKRSAEGEMKIIRKIFHNNEIANTDVASYLESFCAGNNEKLYPLSAWFLVSIARISASSLKKKGKEIPRIINAMGERYAQTANEAGFERSVKPSEIVKTIIEKSGGFEEDSFSRFLKICLDMTGDVIRKGNDPDFIVFGVIFAKYIAKAETAVNTLNINTTLALEQLLFNLRKAIIDPASVKGKKESAYG